MAQSPTLKTDAEAFAAAMMRTEKGGVLSFRHRPYLRGILQDRRRRHVCIACAQSGKTVTYMTKLLQRLVRPPDDLPRGAIYTFPSKTDVQEFVSMRVNTMFSGSEELSGELSEVDNSSAKLFKNRSAIYFRGTMTEKAAISVPADILVHDELDRSRPDTLQLYKDRLRASRDKSRYVFSTPTVPGFGVSRLWLATDQSEWFWTCFFCGHEQVFAPVNREQNWQDCLDLEAGVFRCQKCSAPVEREWVEAGRWVPMNPGAREAGYHITGIMPPESSAEELAAEYSEALYPELVVQSGIGLAETSGEKSLAADQIAFGEWRNTLASLTPTVAGLDQGKYLDMICGYGDGRVIAVHRFDDWPQVHSAMKTLRIRMLVADMAPDARPIQNLIKAFPGRVIMANYGLKQVKDEEYFQKVKNEPQVQINRTAGLDAARERIIMQEDVFPALPQKPHEELVRQLCAIERTTVKSAAGIPEPVWIETGPDHFSHSHLYYLVALQLAPRTSRSSAVVHKEAGHGNV